MYIYIYVYIYIYANLELVEAEALGTQQVDDVASGDVGVGIHK